MEKNPREIALDILLDIEKNKIFSSKYANNIIWTAFLL